jgi:hypothetical protein
MLDTASPARATPFAQLAQLRARPDADRITYTSADGGMYCTVTPVVHASRADAERACEREPATRHALIKTPMPSPLVAHSSHQRGVNVSDVLAAGRRAGDSTVYTYTVRPHTGGSLFVHCLTGTTAADEPYAPGGMLRVIRAADGRARGGPLVSELVTWHAAPIGAE